MGTSLGSKRRQRLPEQQLHRFDQLRYGLERLQRREGRRILCRRVLNEQQTFKEVVEAECDVWRRGFGHKNPERYEAIEH